METISTIPFEITKKDLLKKFEEKETHYYGIKYIKNTTDKVELLKVIKDYIRWILKNKVVNVEWLEDNFGTNLLLENNIYTRGNHKLNIKENKTSFVALGTSSISFDVWDNSSVTFTSSDTSKITFDSMDTSNVAFEAWGNSKVSFETLGNSNVTCKAFYTSDIRCENYDYSTLTLEAWDMSNITCKTFDLSNIICQALDYSSITCKSSDTSNITCGQYNNSNLTHSFGGCSCVTIKHITKKKLFIKTKDYEITKEI